ncbi:MarR family transcriptional regulator [Amycolatopsis antarctica]|uniref:MarR family transcriptional regulator n=2 Tax=Amycolatopsis antarctica TaxID=1854586 RepID=A0A263CYF9_9PSEU|nr:MarR family transcriptional regulator [Amycolatopsis antarctica]
MDLELERSGLTSSRAHVLWVLADRGPSMQQRLASDLEVSPRNVTALVDALVSGGFVSRETHPADRRACLVTLTAAGKRAVTAMARGRETLAVELFGSLSARDRAVAARVLTGAGTRLAELVAAQESRRPR